MKVSYKHIVEYIAEKPSISEISNKLFQLGHEHEIEGDIFDLELTPNRGDCLSLKGLLRDLSLFYSVIDLKDAYDKKIDFFDINFTNKAQDACSKISFLKIDVETVPTNYKNELKSYFDDMDIKKNNFFY